MIKSATSCAPRVFYLLTSILVHQPGIIHVAAESKEIKLQVVLKFPASILWS